jgi:hypothetical protein
VDWSEFTNVSKVLSASIIKTIIALMMEAANISVTLLNSQETGRCYSPEFSRLCLVSEVIR